MSIKKIIFIRLIFAFKLLGTEKNAVKSNVSTFCCISYITGKWICIPVQAKPVYQLHFYCDKTL